MSGSTRSGWFASGNSPPWSARWTSPSRSALAGLPGSTRNLDSIITGAPVLPLRFGAVLTDEDAVVEELLDPHHDEFVKALEDLEGQLEYVVKGRYVERAMLQEVLSGNSEAAALGEQIRGKDPYATREERIRLGEIISNAVAAMRDEDTGLLLSRLEGHCTASFVRDPTHELERRPRRVPRGGAPSRRG